jgi:hypothetical protein
LDVNFLGCSGRTSGYHQTRSFAMPESQSPVPLSKTAWIIGFLLFPYGPFVCLRLAGIISTLEAALGLILSAVVHAGLISVLTQTNGERLQVFIDLLVGASMFVLGFWIFCAGQKRAYWSANALRQWRFAARFFGGLLGVGLVLNILSFHLMALLKK